MHLNKPLLALLTLILLASCNNSSSNSCGSAWIGGEVVNPKKDYVILSHSRNVIDTIALDENNFFKYEIAQLEPGIYFFVHNEYQALFIEPGDSIMLRVNTLEFDESMSYTGKGADKNNLMMEMFLQNEAETELMPAFYMLEPSAFEFKLDSLKQGRWNRYQEFKEKKNPSKAFQNIMEANIKYDIYSKKELYLSANARKKVYNENFEIPASFYNFRKDIDYGNETLRSYYPYHRYLSYHLDNLAYQQYGPDELFDRESYQHNLHKLQLIDSLIKNDSLKNSLLRSAASRYFINAKNEQQERQLLKVFSEKSTNAKDVKEIEALAQATIQLTPGHTIPNLALLTTENTVKDLHSTLNGLTVIYFWSAKSIKHHKKIHTRAEELKGKYPEYSFIGINLDSHFKKWLKIVNATGYSDYKEYQFEDVDEAEMKLVINSVNKAMIVDGKGKILNGNTNIFDMAIENEMLNHLND